ncbi:MAG TPA: hypothetical protein VLB74_13125 [Flavobacterium sp.]|uniref:hypothetical protein n=1 Tax=Flavobacterium sp. TaxID=239 RepID=UPI002BDD2713|nr:hypothetical protein [Flavobacterium sp.]HSD15587.1 hypothetical protein [Flavobacterium sp.]
MKRIVMYPKDVMQLLGKSERQSRQILANIKKKYNKEKHQPVTVYEFCEYMGLDPKTISGSLRA